MGKSYVPTDYDKLADKSIDKKYKERLYELKHPTPKPAKQEAPATTTAPFEELSAKAQSSFSLDGLQDHSAPLALLALGAAFACFVFVAKQHRRTVQTPSILLG